MIFWHTLGTQTQKKPSKANAFRGLVAGVTGLEPVKKAS